MRGILKNGSKKIVKKEKRKKYDSFDFTLFATILILLGFGVVMVYSASFYKATISESDGMYFFKRQAGFGVIGLLLMLFISKVDYHKFKKLKWLRWLGLGVSATLLVITILKIPGLTHSAYGATRWIKVPIIGQFQPSEIVKYAVILFVAIELSRFGVRIKKFKGLWTTLITVGFFAGLIYAQNSLSVAMITAVVCGIMIFAAGADLRMIGGVAGLGIIGILGIVNKPGFRSGRMATYFDPWSDPTDNGYQIIQSFFALGSGGIFGLGLGESRQKTMYLPEPHNDFIFAIIGEELGLVGCLFVIALFILFVYRGIVIAITAKEVYGTLLAIGITGIIGIQAIMNIAVVTGAIPVTGVPLPFISYGGTALVINLCAMGVLLNISRQCEREY